MFNFKYFCEVGNYLSKIDEESFNRSAISRYYYSIFCCVRMYLVLILHEREFIRGRDSHRRICLRLIKSHDSTEKALGLKLEELRQLRNDADYNWDLNREYFRQQINDVKVNTRTAHEYLNALMSSPPFKL